MNQKNFKQFKNHVKKWRDLFGLKQYRLVVELEKLEDKNTAAETNIDRQNGLAFITLNKKCKTPKAYLDELAFHEVVEILLDPLRKMGNSNFNWDVVDKEVHKVIRTLENVVYR